MRWVLSPASIRIRIFLSRFHECFSTMEYFHHLINSVRLISDGMLLAFVPKWLCNEIFFRRSSRNERLRARLNNGAKQHFRSVKLIFLGRALAGQWEKRPLMSCVKKQFHSFLPPFVCLPLQQPKLEAVTRGLSFFIWLLTEKLMNDKSLTRKKMFWWRWWKKRCGGVRRH